MSNVQNSPESYKLIPFTGPGMDMLDNRKEHNNHSKVSATELRASFDSVKVDLLAGLNALVAK